jgi:solute carrier family 25 phosphate transporter 3
MLDKIEDTLGKLATLEEQTIERVEHNLMAKGRENYAHKQHFYKYCALGGALACGITHGLMTPLDFIKTNLQANPGLFRNTMDGFSKVMASQGYRGLYTGFSPTLIGYSIQGCGKYGFYEFFKHKYTFFFSEENASKYRDLIWLAAAASAEFLADIGLCAFESTRVRIQTSLDPRTLKPTFARGTIDGMAKIGTQEGLNGLFKTLKPLWARQIPYTMMKFLAFERTVEFTYFMLPKPKEEYSKPQQIGVSFFAGYVAGLFAATVSQPADNLISVMNREKGITLRQAAEKLTITEMFLKGLGPRIVLVGTLTALQWTIYDAYKVYMDFPTTGRELIPKH